MIYVTYDNNGTLTGCYRQDLAHSNAIEVADEVAKQWTSFAANDDRDGVVPIVVVPPLPTLEDYDAALTAHLDSVAQTKRYADRISCSVRAGYPGPFQAEGIAFAQWMDACNAAGYAMLEDFVAGNIPQPTIAEVLAALPVMVWPT